jgi:hypothetical protein
MDLRWIPSNSGKTVFSETVVSPLCRQIIEPQSNRLCGCVTLSIPVNMAEGFPGRGKADKAPFTNIGGSMRSTAAIQPFPGTSSGGENEQLLLRRKM